MVIFRHRLSGAERHFSITAEFYHKTVGKTTLHRECTHDPNSTGCPLRTSHVTNPSESPCPETSNSHFLAAERNSAAMHRELCQKSQRPSLRLPFHQRRKRTQAILSSCTHDEAYPTIRPCRLLCLDLDANVAAANQITGAGVDPSQVCRTFDSRDSPLTFAKDTRKTAI